MELSNGDDLNRQMFQYTHDGFLTRPLVDSDGQTDDIVRFSQRIQKQLDVMSAESRFNRVKDATKRISDLYRETINKRHLFVYTLLAYEFHLPDEGAHIGTVDEYQNVWVEGLLLEPTSIVLHKPTIVLPIATPKVSFHMKGEYVDMTPETPIHVPVEAISSHLT